MRATFVSSALLLMLATSPANAQPLPEESSNQIGYASPDAAITALRAKPGVTEKQNDKWLILEDTSEQALWTFAKPGNPAYPSAVKRTIVDHNLNMVVSCGASKEACDTMVRQYQALNAKAIEAAK